MQVLSSGDAVSAIMTLGSLHLLYVDRTDAIYQFVQRSLLTDPDHDQTICRNTSILHA
jgi:hypothetical protein